VALDPALMAQLGIKRGSELDAPEVAAPRDAEDIVEGPAVLPWNAAQGASAGRGTQRSAASKATPRGADEDDTEIDGGKEEPRGSRRSREPGERSNRSIERQHRENRIAAGTLRVPQVRRGQARSDENFEARAFGEEQSEGSSGGAAGYEDERPGAARAGATRGKKRRGGPARGGSRGAARAASGRDGEDSPGSTAPEAPAPPAPAPSWADVGAPPAWATAGELPERVSALLEDWDRREAEAAELIAAGVEVLPQDEQAAREVVELTDEEAEQLARAICLRLLTAMPRTRHELEKKLLERDVPAAAACAVLDRYEELGIVDDAAFAQAWVESRARSKGFARGRLKQELRRKGVDGEALDHALEQIDTEQERERAEELALRKLGSRTLPPFGYGPPEAAEREKILRRVVGFLARKGYPGGMALSAARAAMERHDAGER
jgi:SOS response regulatory protein OraA/RecX